MEVRERRKKGMKQHSIYYRNRNNYAKFGRMIMTTLGF